MYMRLINCWAERSGFRTYVVPREGAEAMASLPRCVLLGMRRWTSHKRKRGEFGFGPYSDEPRSLQSMGKRV